ncbi:SRPBCC family protein [Azohydromonas australica]|uniref:SRPBCC family protein n=1 Tax=Azohydromonas australica TaxID=364039 RepID=UPI000406B9C5|nr:SRPBCC family protein [Azohydromonas australica]
MSRFKSWGIPQLLVGLKVGALLAYAFDPQMGARRRAAAYRKLASVRDHVAEFGHEQKERVESVGEDLAARFDRRPYAMSDRDASRLDAHERGHALSMLGLLVGAVGVTLAVKALASRDTRRELGRTVRGEPIELEQSIQIAASPEEVFDVWSRYENFPRFMSMVEEVRPLDHDRSHWVVKGPVGVRIEWDSVLTEHERGRVLAWRSESGSTVEHAGRVRLEPSAAGTRATVWMSYTPPAGRLGHAVASLFGRNPRQELEQDLERMKSFIESGQAGNMPGRTSVSGATAGSWQGTGMRS